MPDDPGYAQRLAAAEQRIVAAENNGNYKEAFDQAREFIYGGASPSDAAGWKDRATQLNEDLTRLNILPPFNIIDDTGIAVNDEIATVEKNVTSVENNVAVVDLVRHVSYASGVNLDYIHLKSIDVEAPTGEKFSFKYDDATGTYIEDRNPPRQPKPFTAELVKNPNDPDQPTLVIHDLTNRIDTSFTDNGDKIVSYLGSDGQSLRSTIEQANGLHIDVEGPLSDPDRKVVTYPDGTTVVVAATAVKVGGHHTGWTTTINIPNRQDGGQLYVTADGDLTQNQIPLPDNMHFVVGDNQVVTFNPDPRIAFPGTDYSIDNRTLTLSIKSATGELGMFYMSALQPEIDVPHAPIVQATATAPAAPPEDPFG